MARIYRAIWQEDRQSLERSAKKSFYDWVDDDRPLGYEFDSNGPIEMDVGKTRISIAAPRRVELEDIVVSEFIRRERDEIGTEYTTTFRVIDGSEKWIWVDVERDVPPTNIGASSFAECPAIVNKLLQGAQDPRWGQVRLKLNPSMITVQNRQGSCINLIKGWKREIPVIVFADIKGREPDTHNRAKQVCKSLAGTVAVQILHPGVEALFNREMDEGCGLEAGQARIYFPGERRPDEQRLLDREIVSLSIDSAAQQFARLLQPNMANRQLPEALRQIDSMLRENQGGSFQAKLDKATDFISEMEHTIDDLRTELERSLEEEATLIGEIEQRDRNIRNLLDEIEKQQKEITQQKNMYTNLEDRTVGVLLSSPGNQANDGDIHSVRDAVKLARAQFSEKIVIPKLIDTTLDLLDDTTSSRTFGKRIYQGLLSLYRYADDSNQVKGGFKEWCMDGRFLYGWSAEDYAAAESLSVESHPKFRGQREFPISAEVDPQGKTYMGAHLKISNARPAPRLYFYDDTQGITKKIHVGYIGKHLDTKLFNK